MCPKTPYDSFFGFSNSGGERGAGLMPPPLPLDTRLESMPLTVVLLILIIYCNSKITFSVGYRYAGQF